MFWNRIHVITAIMLAAMAAIVQCSAIVEHQEDVTGVMPRNTFVQDVVGLEVPATIRPHKRRQGCIAQIPTGS